MKKVYTGSILVLTILLLTFFGCGGGGGSSESKVTAENSSYGDYAIAGKSIRGIPESEEGLSNYREALALLQNSSHLVDFYMLRYDDSDPLGWMAISQNTTVAYKLDGVDSNGILKWIEIQGENRTTFVDIYFNAEETEVSFGSTLKDADENKDIVEALANKSFPIEGYLIQYAKNLENAWIYITLDAAYVGLYDDVVDTSNIPQWREIYTASDVEKSALLRIENVNELTSDYIDNVTKTKKLSSSAILRGIYISLMNSTSEEFSITASMVPAQAIAATGESVTFSATLTNDITAEAISGAKFTWLFGPTVTCSDYGYVSVLATANIESELYVTGVLICPEAFSINISGSHKIVVGESGHFEAFTEILDGYETKTKYFTSDEVTWESSNSAVAGVSAEGEVTCFQLGTATITVTAPGYTKSASSNLICVEDYLFSISGPSKLYVGQSGVFSSKVVSKTKSFDNAEVEYSGSNGTVVVEAKTGKVTCIEEGGAFIWGKILNATEMMKVNKDVEVDIDCITGKMNTLTLTGVSPLQVGKSASYNAMFSNEFKQVSNVNNQSVWSSDNKAVATVGILGGIVKCLSEGSSLITVKHLNKNELFTKSKRVECVNTVVSSSSSEMSSSSEASSSSSEASSGAKTCSCDNAVLVYYAHDWPDCKEPSGCHSTLMSMGLTELTEGEQYSETYSDGEGCSFSVTSCK